MLQDEELAQGFVEQARRFEGASRIPDEEWEALRRDGKALGLIGLLAAGCAPAGARPDPEVAAELVGPLDRDLADALGEPPGAPDLDRRAEAFVAAKGARGHDLLARTLARVAYEVYDLRQNRLVTEDVLLAADLVAWAGPGVDARETARRMVRLSRTAARVVLGHLSEQLALVHEIGQAQEVDYRTIDRRLHEFSPRIYAQRLPAMIRFLLPEDARLRLAFVVWARTRGLVLGRNEILPIVERIVPERPLALIDVLVAARPVREALREAAAAAPAARWLDRAFLGRTLPVPS